MADAKEMFEQVLRILADLSFMQKVVAGLVIAVVLGGLILLSTKGGGMNYQILFSSLSQEDAAEVVAKLQEQRIPYELAMNGTVIKVPSNIVLETRLSLAGDGLPRGGGVGFEIFDKSSLGVTDFVQRLNYQRALQGELARTIRQFNQVQEARVHIATPKETIFVEDEKPSSASVSLKLRGKTKLNEHQIQAIVNLVSSAVPGLSDENVTIVDTAGHLLFRKRGGEDGVVSGTQLEYKLRLEKSLRDKVETMLEEIVGVGKSLARVSTDIDFSQVNTTQELFDPEGQVVRSESILNEEQVKPGEQPQGIPGVKGELATFTETGEGGAATQGSNVRNNVTRNFEISKIVKQVKSASGAITRLSVAVMVDGAYEKTVDKDGKASLHYKPRPAEELKWLETMVKNAVGYNAERGDKVEIVGMAFAASQTLEPQAELIDRILPIIEQMAMPLVYLISAICAILFIIRPFFALLSKKQMEGKRMGVLSEAEEAGIREQEEELALRPLGLTDRERIYKLAQSDPSRAADLVKRWLREGM
jgi:flagellar M-ring protein FliF